MVNYCNITMTSDQTIIERYIRTYFKADTPVFIKINNSNNESITGCIYITNCGLPTFPHTNTWNTNKSSTWTSWFHKLNTGKWAYQVFDINKETKRSCCHINSLLRYKTSVRNFSNLHQKLRHYLGKYHHVIRNLRY